MPPKSSAMSLSPTSSTKLKTSSLGLSLSQWNHPPSPTSSTSSKSSSLAPPYPQKSHSGVGHLLDRFGLKFDSEQRAARNLYKVYPGMWLAIEDQCSASGHPILDRFDEPVELMRTPTGDPFSHVLALSSRDAPGSFYNVDLHQVRTSLQLPPPNLMASWGIPDLSVHQLFAAKVFFGSAESESIPIKRQRRRAAGHRHPVNVLIVTSLDKITEAVALASCSLASYELCSLDDARCVIEESMDENAEFWQGRLSLEGVKYLRSTYDEMTEDMNSSESFF